MMNLEVAGEDSLPQVVTQEKDTDSDPSLPDESEKKKKRAKKRKLGIKKFNL